MVSSTAVTSSSSSGEPIDHVQPLLEALKAIGAGLKAEGVPFALAGSYAVYARGGARSLHDVDFVVPLDSIPAAAAALEKRGFRLDDPPEDWLVKVWRDDLCIDLIHTLSSGPVTGDLLGRADELTVESVLMPVMSATDLLVSKLLSLNEHRCDLEPVLAVARSLREQVDPGTVGSACRGQVFAQAALYLLRTLGVLPGVDVAPLPAEPEEPK
jgi:putative nucleotidyltransferase-like protein